MTTIDLPRSEAVEDLAAHLRATSPDFGGLIARYGHAALAFRQLGLMQWEAGNLAVAIEAFLAALALDPENADLWRDAGAVYSAMEESDLAIASLRTSLILNARHPQTWLTLAGLLDRCGQADEAAEAYHRVIALEPTSASAHFGLGLSRFRRKRYADALASLRLCVRHDPGNGLAQACLGHLLYIDFDFAASAAAFDAAALTGPLDPESNRKRARALTLQTMMDGRVPQALAAYPSLAGDDREDLDIVADDAFAILSACGHLEAAEIGRLQLLRQPGDPVRRYLLDAVSGCEVSVAPRDYIERYFDHFAPRFDSKLVDTLGYVAPRLMTEMVTRRRTRFARILDLGCGTGLAAEGLSALGSTLVGVDLSSGMLAEAEKRGRYSALVKTDVVDFLGTGDGGRFDLVFAADLMIYFGDLAALMHAIAGAMPAGGLLVLNLEAGRDADFCLLPSGRFSHSSDYIRRLTAPDFSIVDFVEDRIRLEASQPVAGYYLLLERR